MNSEPVSSFHPLLSKHEDKRLAPALARLFISEEREELNAKKQARNAIKEQLGTDPQMSSRSIAAGAQRIGSDRADIRRLAHPMRRRAAPSFPMVEFAESDPDLSLP